MSETVRNVAEVIPHLMSQMVNAKNDLRKVLMDYCLNSAYAFFDQYSRESARYEHGSLIIQMHLKNSLRHVEANCVCSFALEMLEVENWLHHYQKPVYYFLHINQYTLNTLKYQEYGLLYTY